MGIADNKSTVVRVLEALATADFNTMLSCMSDDIEFYVIGSTDFSGSYTGKQALLEKILMPMAGQRDETGYSEEILQIVAEGNTVATESKGRKTTLGGQAYNNEYAYFFSFRNGKICRWRCYLDTMLLHQTHKKETG